MMSRPVTLKPSTWETVDTDNTRGSSHHDNNNPPNPPPYSGYVYVPAHRFSSQTRTACEDSQVQDHGSIQATQFPLPPTLIRNPYQPNPYRYHTFPPPAVSPSILPSSTAKDSDEHSNADELCYFETLDFSDYLHPNHSPSHRPNNNPSKCLLSSRSPLPHSIEHEHAYRPRRSRPLNPLANLYNSIATSTLLVITPDTADKLGLEAETAWRLRRGWHAVREGTAVICVVLLVAGVLVGLGWVLVKGFGLWAVAGKSGRFVDVGGNVDVDGQGAGDWPLCTAARPRFCRIVVGAGR